MSSRRLGYLGLALLSSFACEPRKRAPVPSRPVTDAPVEGDRPDASSGGADGGASDSSGMDAPVDGDSGPAADAVRDTASDVGAGADAAMLSYHEYTKEQRRVLCDPLACHNRRSWPEFRPDL